MDCKGGGGIPSRIIHKCKTYIIKRRESDSQNTMDISVQWLMIACWYVEYI